MWWSLINKLDICQIDVNQCYCRFISQCSVLQNIFICCRNKHFSEFPLFFNFGETKYNSEKELFATYQHLFQSTTETRIIMAKIKEKVLFKNLMQLLTVKFFDTKNIFFKYLHYINTKILKLYLKYNKFFLS